MKDELQNLITYTDDIHCRVVSETLRQLLNVSENLQMNPNETHVSKQGVCSARQLQNVLKKRTYQVI